MARLRDLELVEDRFDLGTSVLAIRRPTGVEQLVEAGTPVSALYWATPWPSGCALAREVAGLPLQGSKVVELGAGLGLPALAAARAGATVLATDVQKEAMALLRQNARRAIGRRIHTLRADVGDPPQELLREAPFDLVLGADVLYRPELPEAFAALLPRLLAPGGAALLAYPWAGQADPLIELLEPRGWRSHIREIPVPRGLPSREVHLARLWVGTD
jgi:predicted nicotinamide N-methyase